MRVREVGTWIEFLPVTVKDISVLQSFPGFIRINGRFLCPKKAPVIRNLLDRLSRKPGLKIDVDDSCMQYLEVAALKQIPEDFPFVTKPLEHQLIALRFLYTNNGGGLLLDPGLGKTKVVLDYIFLERFERSLVICPKPLTFVWMEEASIHRPELSVYVFKSSKWEEEIQEASKYSVWVMTYKKSCLMQEYLERVTFNALFVDEALIKDPSSEQTQAITSLSKRIPVKVLMSGTLVNNTEADVFSPVRIMEPSLVGTSFGAFRDEYLEVWQPYPKDETKKHIKVVVGTKNPKACRDILNATSIVMRKEKWLPNLPPKTFIPVNVVTSDEIKEKYYEFLTNYITQIDGEYIEADNPLSALAKLSQFSSGFVYKDNADMDALFLEKPKRAKKRKLEDIFFFEDSAKINALRDLLTKDLANRKLLLWYSMDAEAYMIERLLKELKISYEIIRGGSRKIGEKVKRFNTDATLQILVCQAKTLNYGVTTLGKQAVDEDELAEILLLGRLNPSVFTQVFFSFTYSLEVFLQQQDRIHRIGQTHECFYYLLISDLPTELKLLEALKNKQELREFVLEDIIHKSRHELV